MLIFEDCETWRLPPCPRLASLTLRLYFKDRNSQETQEQLWKDDVSILNSLESPSQTSQTPLRELELELGADSSRILAPLAAAPWRTIRSAITRLGVANAEALSTQDCIGLEKVLVKFTHRADPESAVQRRKAVLDGLGELLNKSNPVIVIDR